MIEIKNMTKTYGNKIAVDQLNLSIPKGEFFCFLGPNGAGKTTTIKVLTGLLKPSHGAVSILGMDVQTQYMDVKRNVSYIPDFPYLYEKLTAREFLHFIADMYDLDKAIACEKIRHYLDMFCLTERADNLLEDFSHGMKQKVVISAALIHDPQVIIVDEPMVGLDPQGIRQVKDLLKNASRRGVTIFMSTHTLSIAEELADRIAILNQGRVVTLGSKEDLAREYGRQNGLEKIFLKLLLE